MNRIVNRIIQAAVVSRKWKYIVSFVPELFLVEDMIVDNYKVDINKISNDVRKLIENFINQFATEYKVEKQAGTLLFNIYTNDDLSDKIDIGEYIGTMPEEYNEDGRQVEVYIGDNLSIHKN